MELQNIEVVQLTKVVQSENVNKSSTVTIKMEMAHETKPLSHTVTRNRLDSLR